MSPGSMSPGPMSPGPMSPVHVGDELPGFTATLTRADLRAYAAASADSNRIHLDEQAARAAGLPGVVAHGMATFALAARLVTSWAGADYTVTALRTRFSRPVVVPDDARGAQVVVAGRVAEVGADGSVQVRLSVTSGGNAVLLQARAVLSRVTVSDPPPVVAP